MIVVRFSTYGQSRVVDSLLLVGIMSSEIS